MNKLEEEIQDFDPSKIEEIKEEELADFFNLRNIRKKEVLYTETPI